MYIVGHALTTAGSVVEVDELLESGLLPLMLPDYADSHNYAYAAAWAADTTADSRLVRGHIAGDWWIHFGDDMSKPAVRRGWAYKRMNTILEFYDEFFTRAHEHGLRPSAEPNDSKRGWAHSFMEYSVDTYVCRNMFDDRFYSAVKKQLGDIGSRKDEVLSLFATQSVVDPDEEQWASALEYSSHVHWAQTPEEFSALGLVRKFGLTPNEGSVSFVERYMDTIIERVGEPELHDVVQSIARFVSDVENLGIRPAIPGPPERR